MTEFPTSDWVVANVGSGTGFMAELFLANGDPAIGVEPNIGMRAAAEERLAGSPKCGPPRRCAIISLV